MASKLEYLQRYMAKGSETADKKGKKKRKNKDTSSLMVVDGDHDWEAEKPARRDETGRAWQRDDAENDDAPTVVAANGEEVDPEDLPMIANAEHFQEELQRGRQQQHNNKSIGSPARATDEDLSPPRKTRKKSDEAADASPPRRRARAARSASDDDENGDASPPRRSKPAKTMRKSNDDDASPPRRSRRTDARGGSGDDDDASPPRRRASSSPSPRKQSPSRSPVRNTRHSRSRSRERRGRRTHRSLSRSPRRRSRERGRGRRSSSRSRQRAAPRRSSSRSPVRRRRSPSPRDNRRSRRRSSTSRSPDGDRHNRHDHRRRVRSTSRSTSLPRKESTTEKSTSSLASKEQPKESNDRPAKAKPREPSATSAPPPAPPAHPVAAAESEYKPRAGLFTANEFADDLVRKTAHNDILRGAKAEDLGHQAETVYRDKKGRKLDMLNEMAKQQELLDGKRTRQANEQYEWGTGRVQKEELLSREQVLEKMKTTPFARHAEDAELDKSRREKSRAFDPINSKVFQDDTLFDEGKSLTSKNKKKNKTTKKNKKSSASGKPKYAGPPAPANRFHVQPGYRWDGVVRGTAWEEKLMLRANAHNANSEDAYRYAVADM